MDGMAPFGPSRDFGIYGAARFELLDQLKDVAKGWDIRYTPDPKPEAGLFFRSDHFPFAKRGVPALSGRPARTGWTVASPQARKPPRTTPPSVTTSRATNGSRTGCSPVPPATWKCCTRWATSWPTPCLAELEQGRVVPRRA